MRSLGTIRRSVNRVPNSPRSTDWTKASWEDLVARYPELDLTVHSRSVDKAVARPRFVNDGAADGTVVAVFPSKSVGIEALRDRHTTGTVERPVELRVPVEVAEAFERLWDQRMIEKRQEIGERYPVLEEEGVYLNQTRSYTYDDSYIGKPFTFPRREGEVIWGTEIPTDVARDWMDVQDYFPDLATGGIDKSTGSIDF